MSLVLDASVVLHWLVRGEEADALDSLFRDVAIQGAIAPNLIDLEVANGLRNYLRTGRRTIAERDALLGDFRLLPLERRDCDVAAIVALSDRADLTSYDAAYLQLALETGFSLVTLDVKLRNAGSAEGVVVVPASADLA